MGSAQSCGLRDALGTGGGAGECALPSRPEAQTLGKRPPAALFAACCCYYSLFGRSHTCSLFVVHGEQKGLLSISWDS